MNGALISFTVMTIASSIAAKYFRRIDEKGFERAMEIFKTCLLAGIGLMLLTKLIIILNNMNMR